MNTENKYQKSIDCLNDAIGKEIATSLQCMYFHVHVEDAGYKFLASYFRKVSIEEMRHIEEFSERIMFLEGDVDMNPAFETRRITDIADMLRFAIKVEQNTIDTYNAAAQTTAEINDTVTHHIFQQVTQCEEQHLDNFRIELQNITDYGKNYLALQSIGHSKEIAKK